MKRKNFYYLLITLAFVIMATFNACKPEPEPQTPGSVSVTTSSVSNITETSAKCGGTVTASGYSVGACGLCYSELPNPTINSYITSDQMGTGTFTSTMSGLEPGTKYYVRAYATTSSGTLYGEQKEFTTLGDNNGGDDDDDDDNGGGNGGDDEEATKPTVTTNSVSNITFESATCGGNVTDDGGANVTARGVCWSTSQNPTISDNKTTDGSGTGSFTSNLINLNENTTYYVRAYATNEKGTSYGEQKSFTTLDPTINGYEYVDLGLPSGLKWATCNVGASSPEDYGDYFAWGETSPKAEYSLVTYLHWVDDDGDGYWDYGEITVTSDISGNPQYDAATANWGGSWRMPTEDEMQELVDYCEWEWTQVNGVNGSKVVGPNGSCIFLPAAGYRSGSSLYNDGNYGYYWSSTPCDDFYDAYVHGLLFGNGRENVFSGNRDDGLTVRPISE